MAALLINTLSNTPAYAIETFFYALLGGVLPALFWLWFWMHEGHEHHEPKDTIVLTFIVGMCAVFIVYPLQKMTGNVVSLEGGSLPSLLIWAGLEELIKFACAYFIALKLKDIYDAPIDAFIYMATAALGFAAMENTLFLLTPLMQGDVLGGLMTGSARFMGASLLHVAASGAFSIFISAAYYKGKALTFIYGLIGLIVAILIHTAFNWIIVVSSQEQMFIAFSFVWITIVLIILSLEKVKRIKKF